MYHRKNKITKNGIIELLFVCIIVAAFIYMVAGKRDRAADWIQQKASAVTEGWYYLDGNEKIPVTLPAVIEKEEGDSLTLYNDSFTEEDEGKTLTTKGARYNLKIAFQD